PSLQLRLRDLLHFYLVEGSGSRGTEESYPDDALAGFGRNAKRLGFLVPTAGARKWADQKRLELTSLLVIQRKRDVSILVALQSWHDVLGLHKPLYFQQVDLAAVDAKTLQQVCAQSWFGVLEFDVMLAVGGFGVALPGYLPFVIPT